MIQKYTCVPASSYETIVVTNGSLQQVKSKLANIEGHLQEEISPNGRIKIVEGFHEMVGYIGPKGLFDGKVLFMFFNGLDFISDFISDAIDYSNQMDLLTNLAFQNDKPSSYPKSVSQWKYIQLENAYFYFDSTISESSPLEMAFNENHFHSFATIANDVLKKTVFMVSRIRCVLIDDVHLMGEKGHSLSCVLRNFPTIENLSLLSHSNVSLKGIVA